MTTNLGAAPAAAAHGLELFAAAWSERYFALGGDLIAYDDGRMLSFRPEAGYGRRTKEKTLFGDNLVDGAFRELETLLEAVPGGRDAVWRYARTVAATCRVEGGLATW